MRTLATLPLALLFLAPLAQAKEYPIGEPQLCPGLEVGAVYLQPIEMAPAGMMRATADSDVHLEADIRATADNKQGFQEGSFVPYLNVSFQLKKQGNDTELKGDFHAMVANDGPHYGDNVKLLGPGKYQLTFTVLPPGGHGSLVVIPTRKPAWRHGSNAANCIMNSSTPGSVKKAGTEHEPLILPTARHDSSTPGLVDAGRCAAALDRPSRTADL